MRKSFVFYKELTPAEVGNTGTHEIYIRLPNNFDYVAFFGNTDVVNGSVTEVNFSATDETDGLCLSLPLRFVYFHSSNHEKRIPSLGELFRKHNIHSGDIVRIESVINNEGTIAYFIKFFKKGIISISPNALFYSNIEADPIISPKVSTTNLTLQCIFYGAPGTGKSHTINETTEKQPKENVFRTTFHPDSDYSTFVGCYKPSMANNEPLYEIGELINKLSEIKTSGVTYPCHKFAAKYWESLKDLSSDEIKKILTDCGFTETMNVEISKGIAVGEDLAKKADNKKIVYSFVPQSFTKAYLRAWQTEEPVYLVIEEINRGNCAQIFGDLFQLLDRKEGMSEYPIKTDSDLGKYISGILTNSTRTDIPDSVIKGEELILPANLYRWATMNTSDQSLFPIDSAFKRRWDWKYIPISDAKKNYVIEVDGDQYDWWSFLEIINGIIEDTTRSEDKKLGYFFAKANDGRITSDTFVNKVIFYLWNDVFKDNESEHKAFKDENGDMFAFHEFFHQDGSINTDTVIKFLMDLEVDPFEDTYKSTDQPNNTISNAKRARDKSRYRVNTTDNLNKAQMTREAFKSYIESHPDSDAQAIAQAWNGLGLKGIVQHLVETESEFLERTKESQDSNKRAVEFILANDEKIYLSTQFGIGNIDKFIDAINNAGWNIRIDKTA